MREQRNDVVPMRTIAGILSCNQCSLPTAEECTVRWTDSSHEGHFFSSLLSEKNDDDASSFNSRAKDNQWLFQCLLIVCICQGWLYSILYHRSVLDRVVKHASSLLLSLNQTHLREFSFLLSFYANFIILFSGDYVRHTPSLQAD